MDLKMQFEYLIEHIRDGVVISSEVAKNLVPNEGLNYVVGTALLGVTPTATWFLGLFEANYTPTPTLTAATVAALSTETTAYSSATRPAWVPGAVVAGVVDNSASKAEFTFNDTKTIYGGFLISSSVKGGVAGAVVSAVNFASPKPMTSGDVLRITAGLILVSA